MIVLTFLALLAPSCVFALTLKILSSGSGTDLSEIKTREEMELTNLVRVKTNDPEALLRLYGLHGAMVVAPYVLKKDKRDVGEMSCIQWSISRGTHPESAIFYGVTVDKNFVIRPLCTSKDSYSYKEAKLFCEKVMERVLAINEPENNVVVCGPKIKENQQSA